MKRRDRWQQGNPGRGAGLWSLFALLAVVVVLPTVCMLWFMGRAVANERLAVRQRLVEVYGRQVEGAAKLVEQWWGELAGQLVAREGERPAQVFGRLVESGPVDSAVVIDGAGVPAYPGRSEVKEAAISAALERAGDLELSAGKPAEALAAYRELEARAASVDEKAQALLGEGRCLLAGGDQAGAREVLLGRLAEEEFAGATDATSRLIAPAATLLALERLGLGEGERDTALERLAGWLDYQRTPQLPAGQRLFLMTRWQELTGRVDYRAAIEAEGLAAEYLSQTEPTAAHSPRLTALAGVWQVASADGSVIALSRQERLAEAVVAMLGERLPLTSATLGMAAPSDTAAARQALVLLPLDEFLPQWRLAVRLKGDDPFTAAAQRQILLYFWAGGLGVVAVAAVGGVTSYKLRRQAQLARLKNDLIANVTHELKTPLASIRLLVDTLLEGPADEERLRDYLRLVSHENERLTRLIENFLAFSRMERNKQVFDREVVSVAELLEPAAEVGRQRLSGEGCRFEYFVQSDLPSVEADRQAMLTAVLNLLDNACKYSGTSKRVLLRAYAEAQEVCIEVADNGVGIPRRAQRRIFERFYQVDRRLSRAAGGCGLGLSIVRFIVQAHGGRVQVSSRVGQGSTFTIRLPRAEGKTTAETDVPPGDA